MYNPFSLEGKTILITGASSGIGRSAAIECSRLGAKVIITARNEERLRETLSMMEGEDHSMLLCDMSDTNQIEDMVKALPEIQGLINNAGFTKAKPIPFIGEEDLKEVLTVNTIAPIMVLKLLLKKKKIKAGASVVFTSSVAGLGETVVGNAIYTSSKGAISAFITCAALELAQKHIRVNAVCPGMVETNILSEGIITSDQIEKDKMNYPLGRYGKPEDVAWAMVYLLSDASAWVTGTNMVVDGGYTVR
jgi:NAD(P)-dependent dehydrogenase (short-subunit alcohol dehydrogenase family)